MLRRTALGTTACARASRSRRCVFVRAWRLQRAAGGGRDTARFPALPPLQRIGKEWRQLALDACDLPVKAYWLCRQESAFAVIWKCRAESEAMKACVASQTGRKDEFDAFRRQRLDDIAPKLLEQRERFLAEKLGALAAAPADAGTRAAR